MIRHVREHLGRHSITSQNSAWMNGAIVELAERIL
jgi:hypothetical protein